MWHYAVATLVILFLLACALLIAGGLLLHKFGDAMRDADNDDRPSHSYPDWPQ